MASLLGVGGGGSIGEMASGVGEAGVIIEVLSRVLTQLIELNRNVTSKNQMITKFQSSYPPSISILAYLERINKFAKCSPSCFIIALIYIDRLIETRNVILSNLNVHRVLISSIMLATKVFDDEFYKNSYYAKLGGVSTQEMNSLELEFLSLMNFDFFVTTETFAKYQKELAAFVVPPPVNVALGSNPCATESSGVVCDQERDGLGLSTPSPPVLLSCGLQKTDVNKDQHHMLGALGQQSQSHQDSGLNVSVDSVVVPLAYEDSSNQFETMTPPPASCAPRLSSSVSHQSYFCGQTTQQPHYQYQQSLGPYSRSQGHVQQMCYQPQQLHHQPQSNQFALQQPPFYPACNTGGGGGRYVTPVTTPTSVADGAAVFSWGSGDSGCSASHQQSSHVKQQPTLLFPSNFYHPAVNQCQAVLFPASHAAEPQQQVWQQHHFPPQPQVVNAPHFCHGAQQNHSVQYFSTPQQSGRQEEQGSMNRNAHFWSRSMGAC